MMAGLALAGLALGMAGCALLACDIVCAFIRYFGGRV